MTPSHASTTLLRLCTTLTLLLACALPAASAHAQGGKQGDRNWELGIAAGAGRRSAVLATADAIDINYVVDFSWYGEHLFFDNGDFGYTFATGHNISVSALLAFGNERNDYSFLNGNQFGLAGGTGIAGILPGDKDNTGKDNGSKDNGSKDNTGILASGTTNNNSTSTAISALQAPLGDRNTALNGGVELLFIHPLGDIQAQLLSDVSNTHHGQTLLLSWSHPWYFRHAEVSLTLGAEWKSRQLVGYYYGVRADEALPGRAQYDGSAGTNTYVRLAARYELSEHWTAAAMVEREFLSGAIKASPIVIAGEIDTFFTGLFYRF